MSILPSVAYNLQNHGTDYNLVSGNDGVLAGSSRLYAWQASSCGSGNTVYLVDTLAQKCLWGSGSSLGVHDCQSSDQAWSIREDDSVDTYTIQKIDEGDNGFLSLYEDRPANLSDGQTSYSQWSFQSEVPPTSVPWNVCDHISQLAISSSSTSSPASLSSTASTQAVTVAASSSLGTSSESSPGSSETPPAVSETLTSSAEQSSAEVTAAVASGSSNRAASELSTPSGAAQTPSGSGLPQSNNADPMGAAWCVLLTALMISVFVVSP